MPAKYHDCNARNEKAQQQWERHGGLEMHRWTAISPHVFAFFGTHFSFFWNRFFQSFGTHFVNLLKRILSTFWNAFFELFLCRFFPHFFSRFFRKYFGSILPYFLGCVWCNFRPLGGPFGHPLWLDPLTRIWLHGAYLKARAGRGRTAGGRVRGSERNV